MIRYNTMKETKEKVRGHTRTLHKRFIPRKLQIVTPGQWAHISITHSTKLTKQLPENG